MGEVKAGRVVKERQISTHRVESALEAHAGGGGNAQSLSAFPDHIVVEVMTDQA